MKHPGRNTHTKRMTARFLWVRLGVLTLSLMVLSLLGASTAFAGTLETVDHFGGVLTKPSEPGQFPEEVQLGGVSGLAVNSTGAGGVSPGTVYAVDFDLFDVQHIVKFGPNGTFEERWDLGVKRCGPATADPANPGAYTHCPPFLDGGAAAGEVGVDVDQATGNVYVLTGPALRVYSPNGELITKFGETDPKGTIAESPGKLHQRQSKSGIAVNEAGEVYVFYEDKSSQHRVMVFKPETPGNYEHYVYAGQGSDIGAGAPGMRELSLDQAGNLYGGSEEQLAEYDPAQPSTPVCTFSLPPSGITANTVNPATGEVFYYSYKNRKIHQLRCNGEGKFVETSTFAVTPERGPLEAMTMDAGRKYDPGRPAGVLYVASSTDTPFSGGGGERGAGPLGYILALPKEIFPSVESESVANVTSSTASLAAQINPNGSLTRYGFQYLDDAAYEANEPDERQSLAVSATGGVFGLGLEGRHFGGEASATLTAGSKMVGALATAKGTATLKGAVGSGTLAGAAGKGTLVAGSNVISSVGVSEGKFEIGQGITAALTGKENVPTGTTITGVAPEEGLPTFEIRISNLAPKTVVGAKITSGAPSLTEVSTSEGGFEVGQAIEVEGGDPGFPPSTTTTITAVSGNELALSTPATKPAVGLVVHAGFPAITSVAASFGSFEVGQTIEGEGIPENTTIRAVNGSELILSRPASKPGAGLAISSSGPTPWAVGEQVEGPGIPPGTTITALTAGGATLSNAATASGSGVILHAGLPASASAAKVRAALEGLPTIGVGNVEVSGGPGDETGSSPYEITFTGALENVDVAQLSADGSGLSGGAATATVQTENDGGGGFSQGAIEVPPGGADLGSGQSALGAIVPLAGLTPATGYHFRAIATSHCSADEAKVCESVGPSQGFHTAPSEAPELSDDRAWELVSPAQKNGGQVIPAFPTIASCGSECKPGAVADRFPMQSSLDGEALVYEGFPFSFTEGAVRFNQYLSKRTPAGWQTTILSPKTGTSGEENGYKAFDPSLTRGLISQSTPLPNSNAPGEFASLYSQDSADPSALSSLLTAEPPNRSVADFKLTYAGASADLSRVFFEANDALTEETPFALEAVDGGVSKRNLYEWSEGQLRLVNVLPGNTETVPGTVFGSGDQLAPGSALVADLSHAISSDGSRVFWSSNAGQVYLRENGETTREISDHSGKFLTASADGSKLLLSDGHLFDLEGGESMVDLTEGQGGFEGIAGQSDDLSRIYFLDTAVLDERPNSQGNIARSGRPNLYSWHEGTTTFLATLGTGTREDNSNMQGDWAASPVRRTAEASPDGHWLAFLSRERLTGYDNAGPCDASACPDAFLYSADTGKLTCVSCNPSNERQKGPTQLPRIQRSPGSLPQPHYLSDSGRMFFDTSNSLSSFDTNGKVEDVYQYEPEGVGSCTRPGGCVSLISAGHEAIDSNFLAADEDGKNVFFTTRDQLVLKDRDDLMDVYDAREGGGIPSETETGRSECQGEACQPLYSPPNDPTPASSSFEGAGNVTEPKAAKKHAKKHKKKHAKKKHAHKRAAKHNRGGAK